MKTKKKIQIVSRNVTVGLCASQKTPEKPRVQSRTKNIELISFFGNKCENKISYAEFDVKKSAQN